MTTTEHDVVIGLSALEHDLSEGTFYEDYDESWRLVGSLREGIAELERLRAENQRLRRSLDDAHLARIAAQNPGIDIEQVKRERGFCCPTLAGSGVCSCPDREQHVGW